MLYNLALLLRSGSRQGTDYYYPGWCHIQKGGYPKTGWILKSYSLSFLRFDRLALIERTLT